MNSLSDSVNRLIDSQKQEWDLARRNYAELKHIRVKTLDFDVFQMQVQFNPERVRSTAAPDPGTAVKKPACFLCAANRPTEQQSVAWGNYEILLNPYPIFDRHLTIPCREHTPQQMTGRFNDMLRLAEALPEFVITFNGARSGASAPDHFHFQAVGKGVLPSEKEFMSWTDSEDIKTDENVTIATIEHYLRPAFIIHGLNIEETAEAAENILRCLSSGAEESQFNILAWSMPEGYIVVMFPRTAHRPKEFYAEGSDRIVFSPGVVDMAGVIITVRPEDFDRMAAPLLKHLFEQVVPNGELWKEMKNQLRDCLSGNR